MASSKKYLKYVLELFNEPNITYKYMFSNILCILKIKS